MYLNSINGALTDVTSVATENPVGALFSLWDETYGRRVFKRVKNNAGAATEASCAVAQDYANAGVTAVKQIKKPATASLNLFGGIALAAATDQWYQWIQVLGYTASLYVLAATITGTMASTAGSSVKMKTDVWYMTDDIAVGTDPTYHRHAIILATYAVSTASATRAAIIFAREW